jgi:glycosyltransferase involved in cell wall biosynthesis
MRLFVVEFGGSGGMVHYDYQLCTALATQGAEVTLVTDRQYEMEALPHSFRVEKFLRLWPPFDPRSLQPPQGRIAVAWHDTRWMLRRGIRGMRLVREGERLTRYLLTQRPDIVQFGSTGIDVMAPFLARLRRHHLLLAQICHEFELREQERGRFVTLHDRLRASVYNQFSVLFFHGENNQRRFLSHFQIPVERTQVIPHFNESLFLNAASPTMRDETAARQHYGFGPQDPVVLFFGNLRPSKGLPDLLKAFALVHRRYHNAKLLIAGFPSKLVNIHELHQLTAAYALSDAVAFDTRYIPIEEVGSLMEMARVVVYPYLTSTQSGSLQIAYAFGRPVIATTVGGLPEVVENGQSGFLVPPACPTKLAAAIGKIIQNPGLAATMGAYAQHLSKTRFSWVPIANAILGVYRRALAKGETGVRRSRPDPL